MPISSAVPVMSTATTRSVSNGSSSNNNGSSSLSSSSSSARRWHGFGSSAAASTSTTSTTTTTSTYRRPTSMMMIPRQWRYSRSSTNNNNNNNNHISKPRTWSSSTFSASKKRRNRNFFKLLYGICIVSICTAWFFPIVQLLPKIEQVQDYNTLPKSGGIGANDNNNNNNNDKICFINSVYGNHVKGAAMDKVTNVTLLRQQEPQYEFFYFTNLEELETPGWTKVLLDISKQSSSSYNNNNNNNITRHITRHITMSRWPKFLGWKYAPIAQHCGLVVYLDGYWVPQMGKSLKYRMLRSEIQQHPYGLLQITHPFGNGIKAEMERIVSGTKDTQDHVDLSLAWLEAQSDFDDNCTLYWNGVFAYDPKNIHFQKASEFFWNRFSLEADSWRDQPLWAYTLHHFGIQPIILAKKRVGFYVKEVLENKGDHHYNETTVMTTTTTTTTMKTKSKTTNR